MLKRISDYCYRIERQGQMKVAADILASESLISDLESDAVRQLIHVASLPGVVRVYAMADIHTGFGFPIGTVAGTDIDNGGVISPSGVGFDINCGVRFLTSNLNADDARKSLDRLLLSLFQNIPTGVGCESSIRLSHKEMEGVLTKGAAWVLKQGYGVENDVLRSEEHGCLVGADPEVVSKEAKKRGAKQLGTLGSGNHFLEIQEVVEVYNEEKAELFDLKKGILTVMIHCGSRGLGHQVCKDYASAALKDMNRKGLRILDRELAYVQFNSKIGKDYFSAMKAAANFAWANRQVIASVVREKFREIFKGHNLFQVYDVSHNIAKLERHTINGKERNLCVHRKGATRAFGPAFFSMKDFPKGMGQPVIVPGDMGSSSFLLEAKDLAMHVSLGSCCHGAGRAMSRAKAKKQVPYERVETFLRESGIIAHSRSKRVLIEESPYSYKDVSNVVDVICGAGIADKIAKLRPLGVIK